MKANGQPTDGYKMPKLSDISRSRGKGKKRGRKNRGHKTNYVQITKKVISKLELINEVYDEIEKAEELEMCQSNKTLKLLLDIRKSKKMLLQKPWYTVH